LTVPTGSGLLPGARTALPKTFPIDLASIGSPVGVPVP